MKFLRLFLRLICRITRHDCMPTGRYSARMIEWQCCRCGDRFTSRWMTDTYVNPVTPEADAILSQAHQFELAKEKLAANEKNPPQA